MRLGGGGAYDSALKVIYYNNHTDFWYPYKITSVNTVCLNETYSKVSTCILCLVHLL